MTTPTTTSSGAERTQLTTLRSLMPKRALGFREALQIAELQACKLLELHDIWEAPIPESLITDQPRLSVEASILTANSGATSWQHGAWRIKINTHEPLVRQRFTLAHEYKHVLDAPFENQIYGALRSTGEHHRQVEQVCDYFAACLLMPKKLVKRAWGQGLHEETDLAEEFFVSTQAMHIRLQTLGLIDRPVRCNTAFQHRLPDRRRRPDRRTFYRSLSTAVWPTGQTENADRQLALSTRGTP